jgi:hypothetical protein
MKKRKLFLEYCRNGELGKLKELSQHYKIYLVIEDGMYEACTSGQVDVMKWLDAEYGVNATWWYILLFDKCFQAAYQNNQLEIVKWLYNEHNERKNISLLDVNLKLISILANTSSNVRLETVQYVYSLCSILTYHDKVNIIRQACVNGTVEIVKWFATQFDISAMYDLLYSASVNGSVEVADFLLNTLVYPVQENEHHNSYSYQNEIFDRSLLNACQKGHFAFFKRLWDVRKKNCIQNTIHNKLELYCVEAAENGHLAIAEWALVEANNYGYTINLKEYSTKIFNIACYYGRFETAKWCIKYQPLISDTNFANCCINGSVEMLKWQLTIHNFNIRAYSDYPFKQACEWGNLDAAKWLLNLIGPQKFMKTTNTHWQDTFYSVFMNGHLEVAQWIYSLVPIDIHMHKDGLISPYIRKNQVETLKWILSLDKFDNNKVDVTIPDSMHMFALKLGYTPYQNMFASFDKYKKKILKRVRQKQMDGAITIFEIKGIPELITEYV